LRLSTSDFAVAGAAARGVAATGAGAGAAGGVATAGDEPRAAADAFTLRGIVPLRARFWPGWIVTGAGAAAGAAAFAGAATGTVAALWLTGPEPACAGITPGPGAVFIAGIGDGTPLVVGPDPETVPEPAGAATGPDAVFGAGCGTGTGDDLSVGRSAGTGVPCDGVRVATLIPPASCGVGDRSRDARSFAARTSCSDGRGVSSRPFAPRSPPRSFFPFAGPFTGASTGRASRSEASASAESGRSLP
jgi:hypothetical protein